MATLILVRHGRTTANASGILAGRLAGVSLDQVGREQVQRAGDRLSSLELAAVFSSPQTRCRQTANALVARAKSGPQRVEIDPSLAECDYGQWQGRPLKELAKEPLWRVVQAQPSRARFPGGESLAEMSARGVASCRRHDEAVSAEYGEHAVWLAVSHGDVIKAILADALGMHLDAFQRIVVDPASISVIRYTGDRPYVLATNTYAGDLGWLCQPPAAQDTHGAVVGGGAGPSPGSA